MTDRSVTVGFSGGVDSTAAVLLMKERYRETVAATMWLYDGQESDFDRLERLTDALGVPFRVLDFRHAFEREVVLPYVRMYESGLTPNPCILCNHALKYGRFLDAVQTDYLALGHYARKVVRDGEYILYRSRAVRKDQSYNLYRLSQKQLDRILFPLGVFESKDAVKAFVREKLRAEGSRAALELIGALCETAEMPNESPRKKKRKEKRNTQPVVRILGNAQMPDGARKESMGACFLKGKSHLEYLKSIGSPAAEPGEFVDSQGNVIGRHEGIAGYTVGQKPRVRKNESVDGMTSPYLVLGTVTGFDMSANRVQIGSESDVFARRIRIEGVSFLSERRRKTISAGGAALNRQLPEPAGSNFSIEVRLSQWSEVYRGRLSFCGGIADGCMPETDEKKDGVETPCGGNSIAIFDSETPMRAPSPGQAAVFYIGDELLGGGIITGVQRP